MGLLPIIEQGQPAGCQADWPLFYMNDFSRMGIVVTGLARAVEVLTASGFRVLNNDGLLQVETGEPLADLFAVLSAHRVAYELSDLVSCVYQG